MSIAESLAAAAAAFALASVALASVALASVAFSVTAVSDLDKSLAMVLELRRLGLALRRPSLRGRSSNLVLFNLRSSSPPISKSYR